MNSCTFFGHRECPEAIRPRLREAIADLMESHACTMFYVGNQGAFDAMARDILREFGANYAVVLAYLPDHPREYDDFSDTMLPEGIETVPQRFAIFYRNRWMLKNSNFVISYITHG